MVNASPAMETASRRSWESSRARQVAPGLLLIAAALLPVAASVQMADWAPTPPLWLVLTIGLGTGALLASVRAPGPLLAIGGMLLGVASVVGSTLTIFEEASLAERWSRFATDLGSWWGAATDPQGISAESLPFTLFLVTLSWTLGFVAAWSLVRWSNIWAGVLFGGFGLAINLTHLSNNAHQYWLFLFLFFAFFLVVWSRTLPPSASPALRDESLAHLRRGVVWSLLVLGLVFLLPHFRVHGSSFLRESWHYMRSPTELIERDFNRLFAAIPGRAPYPYDAFGELLPFRGAIRLGPQVALEVNASQPLYLSARRYTVYTSQGWHMGPVTNVSLDSGEITAGGPSFRSQRRVSYTVNPRIRTDVVFLGGHYVSGNRVDQVAVPESLDIDEARRSQGPLDVLAAELPRAGFSSYSVTVNVSTASEEQLRTAGTDYPPWVRDHYLLLPGTVPQRVQDLARELSASLPNPYDKATAIQDYLRGLEYTLDIPPPPPGGDGVDHFLFELQRGYSQYFGSAMTVLLRSIGVPARLVVGYSPGERVASGEYLVRDLNRHGWTEVYFPELGWVTFEPTPGKAVPQRGGSTFTLGSSRPLGAGGGDDQEDEDEELEGFLFGGGGGLGLWWTVAIWLLVIAAVALVAGGGVFAMVVWRKGMTGSLYADVLFRRICWMARLARVPPHSHETALEFGARLATAIPMAAPLVRDVVSAYVQLRYSGAQRVSREDIRLQELWLRLRWRLLGGALMWR